MGRKIAIAILLLVMVGCASQNCRVVWHGPLTPEIYYGEEVDCDTAKAAVNRGNHKYPDIHHWVQVMK